MLKQAEEEDEPVQLGLKVAQFSEGNSDEPDSDEPNCAESNGDEPRKKLSKKEQAELLRRQVDTVGLKGQPGEKIQSVSSVGMLSEGWDAKTVTHIMGIRAFTSQLLCEQVVGRGLRRTSYETDPTTFFTPSLPVVRCDKAPRQMRPSLNKPRTSEAASQDKGCTQRR